MAAGAASDPGLRCPLDYRSSMSRTDRASLLIHRDQAQVFAALVDPDALRTWLPPKGMHGRFEHFDLREGGSYRLVLTYDDASGAPGKSSADSDVTEVRIVRLVQPKRLSQEVEFESDDPSFRGTMEMEWILEPAAEGTDVRIEARNVPDGIAPHDHAAGLTSSLANLSAFLEA
jgi:uncharacterized protein YndB with AHSA1/START domain